MPIENIKKRGQLRDTFIFLFILISCVPILGLGTISLFGITDSHKKNIKEREEQTLVTGQDTITSFFDTIIGTISTNFDTLDSSSLNETSISWQETYAKKFVEDNEAFLEVSFVSSEGKEIAKYSKISTSSMSLYLSELSLFKKAKEGSVAISPVHSTLNGQSITIASPSILNGKIVNVVIAEVSLTPLILSLEKINLGKTGYLLLFDENKTLVGSKNNRNVNFSEWKKINGNTEELMLSERYESLISSVPVVGEGKRISKLNWTLFVEWPISESDLIIENFRNTVLLTIFISIIVVLILASFIAYRLVKPIKLLEETAHQIEKGNFEKQVAITTDDELEELGEAFNGMALGLKRLEELKNEFVYVAAHELRAPVTAIKGYMELIFDGAGGQMTPEMEKLLSPVKKSNERLVNLVNDLLQVARSEAGKLEILITKADIRNEIISILDEIKPLALKRNMTVVYNKTEIPFVMVNTGSFKEVIMNFVSNAIKYGNDNGSVIVGHEVKDGFVSTFIKDDGRGISEDDQKHLFEKFFRAGDVKKTSIEGTGLGLFITKELVEKMGGKLLVTSELGKGTTFTVMFKIAENEEKLETKTEGIV